MKKFSFLTILILSTLFVMSQDSWTIKLNNKIILKASDVDEDSNKKKLTPSEWNKDVFLEINYKEAEPDRSLKRSIIFVDENDNELIRKTDVTVVKISTGELRKKFAGKHKIRIFTIAIPRDPAKAALVRVRRVHLCTLELP